jgi:hypothetical protein
VARISKTVTPRVLLTALVVTDASIQDFRDAHATDDKLVFREGGVRFVAINTQLFKDASSAPISRQNQLQFLKDNLAVRERTVAFGHIPPFIMSYNEPSAYSPQIESQQFLFCPFKSASPARYFNLALDERKYLVELLVAAGCA